MRTVRAALESTATGPRHRAIYQAIADLYVDLQHAKQPVAVDVGVSDRIPSGKVLVHPVSFAIAEEHIVRATPPKFNIFGSVIPGVRSTYFDLRDEARYYEDMRRSLFTLTHKKAGWDCLRHLEVMASGSLPFFIDIARCPDRALAMYPKRFFLELLQFPGMSTSDGLPHLSSGLDAIQHYQHDPEQFDSELYMAAVSAMLHYTQQVMSTRSMAEHVLHVMLNQSYGSGGRYPQRVLYLTHQDKDMDKGDYLTDFLLHGLKTLLGEQRVVDFPKREGLYKAHTHLNETRYYRRRKRLYGMGYTWGLRFDDFEVANSTGGVGSRRDLERLQRRVANHDFDLVILGSGHRDGWASKLHLWDLVCRHYKPYEVAWLCGSDQATPVFKLKQYGACAGHLFSREGPDII